MTPTATQLYEVCEQTWPAQRLFAQNGWTLRGGAGGGKRVSAATVLEPFDIQNIAEAASAMRDLGQTPLFMIRDGETALDTALATEGYQVIDPVIMYTIPIDRLTDIPIPPVTAFEIWEPLAIMADIWAQGGVGPARLHVMHRARVKTGVLARWNEKPAGVAFAGVHDGICMVHAVEVLPHQRRQGVAQWIMRRAAFWGRAQGAAHVAVLCVVENTAANALYRGLGFQEGGRYHYRILPG
jgi:GNAT superfamily N-acetyltransferase